MDKFPPWAPAAPLPTPPRPTEPLLAPVLLLGRGGPTVLGAGAWYKNCIALLRQDTAFLSPVAGDLDQPQSCSDFMSYFAAGLQLAGGVPAAIAHDLHPDFLSSRHAAETAARLGIPAIAVQHHHAHIAATCAEHGLDEPVFGLALDGVGLGSDGTAWGGELLKVVGGHCQRLGHLQPLALPGGDRAAREPWRMAAAALHALGRSDEIARRFADEPGAGTLATMLLRGINAPQTSSAGRYFDAAAGLLQLCRRMDFEAQAAIALEKLASEYLVLEKEPDALAEGWVVRPDGSLSLLPLLAELAGLPPQRYAWGAALFHITLAAALADLVVVQSDGRRLPVVLGGGCFFNALLRHALIRRLGEAGYTVYAPQRLSAGDAGLAVGQAWVARHVLAGR
ncbi:MAG: hypothetical protein RIR00_724 [Pseudomonadota bacterium]|jgi:hydrogenase maturation protein HypF